MDTPPATDFGYSSQGDLENDSDIILSDHELVGSIGWLPPPRGLSPGPETQTTAQVRPHRPDSDDDWSLVGDDLDAGCGLDDSTTENPRVIRRNPFSRVWDPRPRNSSSPSRSPARRSCPSRRAAITHEPPQSRTVKSFYMYLFGDQ